MRLIGITGGVGAGKTEVLKYIREHFRCEIYLADQVAHEVQAPGQPFYEAIVALLGPEIVKEDGSIDRAVMASRIFGNPELLQQVNGLVHPAVRSYIEARIGEARRKQEVELFFIEAALLIEAGYKEIVDELWYVYADAETRRSRLTANRGYTAERIEGIMSKQLSEEAFRASCDFVIDNSGTLEESARQIDRTLEGCARRYEE